LKFRLAHLHVQPAPIRIIVFLMLLAIAWLPMAAGLFLLIPDANTANIVAMVLLFVGFLLWIQYWGRRVHHESRILRSCGFAWDRRSATRLVLGMGLGIASLTLLMLLEAGLGWVRLTPANLAISVVLEGLLVGLGVGFAEELFFRGWLLDELQRDYPLSPALWANGLIFALLHFLKPVEEMMRTAPAFPGLLLLGMTLVWAKWESAGRDRQSPHGYLGLPVGLHGGLVWTSYMFFVGNVVQETERVSAWVTGLEGNPLAGLMGLLFLAGLAAAMRRRSRSPRISTDSTL
jgi:uncharacterized protein